MIGLGLSMAVFFNAVYAWIFNQPALYGFLAGLLWSSYSFMVLVLAEGLSAFIDMVNDTREIKNNLQEINQKTKP